MVSMYQNRLVKKQTMIYFRQVKHFRSVAAWRASLTGSGAAGRTGNMEPETQIMNQMGGGFVSGLAPIYRFAFIHLYKVKSVFICIKSKHFASFALLTLSQTVDWPTVTGNCQLFRINK